MSTSELDLKDLAATLQELIDCLPSEGASAYARYAKMAEQMQYACDFSGESMLENIPDYGLPEEAREYIIKSVLKDPHDDVWPLELRQAEDMLLAESEAEPSESGEPTPSISVEYDANKLVLPRLPRILEIISHHIPEGFEPALIIAMLPVLGTLATSVRFRYRQTGEIHSFSFMSILMAPSGGGKSFIKGGIDLVLSDFEARSNEEFKKFAAYQKASRDGKQTDLPKGAPRYVPIRMTQASLLACLEHAEGKHLFSYETEIDSLTSNMGRGSYAVQSEIYRKAFDNDALGQITISGDAYSGNAKVYYNLLLAGTPLACAHFCSSAQKKSSENGTSNRIPVAILPNQIGKGAPKIAPYTASEEAEVKSISNYLESCSGMISCPAVDKAIKRWEDRRIREELSTDKQASINQLRIRAAVNGYRAGMLCYLLEKDNSSFTDADIMKFATWVADYTFCMHMLLYGAEIEKFAAANAAVLRGGTIATVKQHPYLAKLPQRFTREEVKKLYEDVGRDPDEARKIINRWLNEQHLITKVEEGCYEKVA